MRKFFGQKSKAKPHSTLTSATGTSTLIGGQLLQRDDEVQTNNQSKIKPNISEGNHTHTLLTTSMENNVTSEASNQILMDESLSNEICSGPSTLCVEEGKDKSKKLFVVVSGESNNFQKDESILSDEST